MVACIHTFRRVGTMRLRFDADFEIVQGHATFNQTYGNHVDSV